MRARRPGSARPSLLALLAGAAALVLAAVADAARADWEGDHGRERHPQAAARELAANGTVLCEGGGIDWPPANERNETILDDSYAAKYASTIRCDGSLVLAPAARLCCSSCPRTSGASSSVGCKLSLHVAEELVLLNSSSIISGTLEIFSGVINITEGACLDVTGASPSFIKTTTHSGGSFGGLGASCNGPLSTSASYDFDQYFQPASYGSSGAGSSIGLFDGALGGGIIFISTTSLYVGGTIRSDGATSSKTGGGSGGSINIIADSVVCMPPADGATSIAGPWISVDGGAGSGVGNGGGGGGRLAISAADFSSCEDFLSAVGGSSESCSEGGEQAAYGGVGTIFLESNGATTLYISGSASFSMDTGPTYSETPIESTVSSLTQLLIANGAQAVFDGTSLELECNLVIRSGAQLRQLPQEHNDADTFTMVTVNSLQLHSGKLDLCNLRLIMSLGGSQVDTGECVLEEQSTIMTGEASSCSSSTSTYSPMIDQMNCRTLKMSSSKIVTSNNLVLTGREFAGVTSLTLTGGETQGSKITCGALVALYDAMSIAEGSTIEATSDIELGCGDKPVEPLLSPDLCPSRVGPSSTGSVNASLVDSTEEVRPALSSPKVAYFGNFTIQLSARDSVSINGYVLGSVVRILTPALEVLGEISTDGRGCSGGKLPGPGSGASTQDGGSGGGGYGGQGGNGTVNGTVVDAEGGAPYGDVEQPCYLGSAGGDACDPSLPSSCIQGASGGGIIVLGDLQCRIEQLSLNGSALLSSRGADKEDVRDILHDYSTAARVEGDENVYGAGGGSGGTILAYLVSLAAEPSSSFSVAGGCGSSPGGGGGGGGRIFFDWGATGSFAASFDGTLKVDGGLGGDGGGDGDLGLVRASACPPGRAGIWCKACRNGTYSNKDTDSQCISCHNPDKPQNAYYDKIGEMHGNCSYVCVDPDDVLPHCVTPSGESSEGWTDNSIPILCGVITAFVLVSLCVCLFVHSQLRRTNEWFVGSGYTTIHDDAVIASRRNYQHRSFYPNEYGAYHQRRGSDSLWPLPFRGLASIMTSSRWEDEDRANLSLHHHEESRPYLESLQEAVNLHETESRESISTFCYRLQFFGHNSWHSQWHLNIQVSPGFLDCVYEDKLAVFAACINELCMFVWWESALFYVMLPLAYPVCLLWRNWRRRAVVGRVVSFLNNYDHEFIRSVRARALGDALRFRCSVDLMTACLDVHLDKEMLNENHVSSNLHGSNPGPTASTTAGTAHSLASDNWSRLKYDRSRSLSPGEVTSATLHTATPITATNSMARKDLGSSPYERSAVSGEGNYLQATTKVPSPEASPTERYGLEPFTFLLSGDGSFLTPYMLNCADDTLACVASQHLTDELLIYRLARGLNRRLARVRASSMPYSLQPAVQWLGRFSSEELAPVGYCCQLGFFVKSWGSQSTPNLAIVLGPAAAFLDVEVVTTTAGLRGQVPANSMFSLWSTERGWVDEGSEHESHHPHQRHQAGPFGHSRLDTWGWRSVMSGGISVNTGHSSVHNERSDHTSEGSFRGARTPNEPTTPPRDSPRAVFARDEFVFPSYDSLRRETGATVAAHADGHADGSTQRKLSTTSSRGRPCQFRAIQTSNGRMLLVEESSLYGWEGFALSPSSWAAKSLSLLLLLWLPIYSRCSVMLRSAVLMGCILLLSFLADSALTTLALIHLINSEPSAAVLAALFPFPAMLTAPACVGALLFYRRLPLVFGRLTMLWNYAAAAPAFVMLVLGILPFVLRWALRRCWRGHLW